MCAHVSRVAVAVTIAIDVPRERWEVDGPAHGARASETERAARQTGLAGPGNASVRGLGHGPRASRPWSRARLRDLLVAARRSEARRVAASRGALHPRGRQSAAPRACAPQRKRSAPPHPLRHRRGPPSVPRLRRPLLARLATILASRPLSWLTPLTILHSVRVFAPRRHPASAARLMNCRDAGRRTLRRHDPRGSSGSSNPALWCSGCPSRTERADDKCDR